MKRAVFGRRLELALLPCPAAAYLRLAESGVSEQSPLEEAMNIAGLVTYKINADWSLDGRWTHPDLAGKTGAEKASASAEGSGASAQYKSMDQTGQ